MPAADVSRPFALSSDPRPRFLRCPACGRTEPRPADALRRLAEGRWPECCGRVLVPAPEVPDSPGPGPGAADEAPWADRRLDNRRPARAGVRVEVRRGGLGMGPNLAVALLDVSTGGAKLLLRATVRTGDRVLVSLGPPGGAWEYRGPAVVRWCAPHPDGTTLAGVRLQRPLTRRDTADLAL